LIEELSMKVASLFWFVLPM